MALHIKSTTKFKVLIGCSALLISGVAALFSVTGVSTLFAGAFWAIVAMMGILEFGKIVVASYLARFWYDLSKTIKTYFIAAIVVLMCITSAGIFGYLSEAYQHTKGDYTIIESQVKILESKKNFFTDRKERLQKDKLIELRTKESNQTRADSLTARNQSITRTRQDIKDSENRIAALEQQITAVEDSIGYYDMKIVSAQSVNIKGELGPLKFVADAFGTTMDNIVKYLIFMLIFVFDPLAVLLFVSLSTMIRKDAEKEKSPEPIEPVQTRPLNSIELHSILTHPNEPVSSGLEPLKINFSVLPVDITGSSVKPDIGVSMLESVHSVEPALETPFIKAVDAPQIIFKDNQFLPVSESAQVKVIETEVTESKPPTPPTPVHEPTPEWHTAHWH